MTTEVAVGRHGLRGAPLRLAGASVAAVLLSLVGGIALSAAEAPRVSVNEFKLPDQAQPTGQFASARNGSIWFSESNSVHGEVLGEITPSGAIRQVYKSGPEAEASGSAVEPNGDVWFDLSASGDQLERLSPSGMATSFPFASAFDTGAGRLAVGPGGTVWFTSDQAIGRLMPTGAETRFPLPDRLTPNGIVEAPNGDIWFDATVAVEAVSVHDYIGRITPTGSLKLYRIPTLGTEPKGLVAGPDGNIWFGARGAIERLTPRGHFARFSMPFPDSQPQGMAATKNGIWFTDPGTNKIGFITLSGKPTEYRSSSRDAGLSAIAVARNGVVWFQDIGDVGGAIGRLSLHG